MHWAVPDFLQRAARHLASQVDLEQAVAVGREAVDLALAGKGGVMPAIVRTSSKPYAWKIEPAPLEQVANTEKKMPREYLDESGYRLTEDGREYFFPLIQGEALPPFINGLPLMADWRFEMLPKRLPAFKA